MRDGNDHWFEKCLLAILFLQIFWDDFPGTAALYVVMFALSALYGINCLRGEGRSPLWDRRGVPEAAQKRFSRIQGRLFLVNAAIGPMGLLVHCFLDFDSDFLLLTQMVGFVFVAALGGGLRGKNDEAVDG